MNTYMWPYARLSSNYICRVSLMGHLVCIYPTYMIAPNFFSKEILPTYTPTKLSIFIDHYCVI